jgi:hypothetical protein
MRRNRVTQKAKSRRDAGATLRAIYGLLTGTTLEFFDTTRVAYRKLGASNNPWAGSRGILSIDYHHDFQFG